MGSRTPIDILLDGVEWEPVNDYGETKVTDSEDLPYVTHKGTLRLGDLELQCAVLSNGKRIFYGDEIDRLVGGITSEAE